MFQEVAKNARECLVGLVVITALFGTSSPAQSATISVAEQPLSSALRQIAQQTGENILFTPSSVFGLRAHPLQGQMTAQEAVQKLLKGTDLVAIADGDLGLLVERPKALRNENVNSPNWQIVPSNSLPEQMIVTSTRITSGGFDAPTPITVLTADQIIKDAQPSIFETVTEIPSLQGSTGIGVNTNNTSTGLNGLSSFGLRGLGTIRTLVLIDGQRVVPANVTGVADISEFPQLLIQRVDIVTGGASASWGSDAVAGVINFVTDKKFAGFKANVLAGITTYGDDANVTLQLAAGTAFDDDRGHIEISSEYSNVAGLNPTAGVNGFGFGPGIGGRTWNVGPGIQMLGIAATPPGTPQYTYGVYAQNFQMAKYGLITAGPLQGIAFGSGGVPFNFQYGSNGIASHLGNGAVVGCVNPICFGGDTSAAGNNGTSIVDTLTRGNWYGRISYDLTPSANIWMTVNFATVHTLNTPNPGAGKNANLTIQCTNPYLPTSVMTACVENGTASFQFGTANGEFPTFITVHALRDQRRFVIGGDGAFILLGKNWTWDTYLQHGENDTSIHVHNISLNPRYSQAIDAVTVTSANVGASGLAIGSIACRSTLATPTNGCEPLDVFGDVPASEAALHYVIPPHGPYQLTHERQEAFSASVNGAPFSDWAGQISIASGIEYREESYRVRGDPYGDGVTAADPNTPKYPADPALSTAGNNWYAGNFHNAAGNYHVVEGFFESAIPLVAQSNLGKADLDLAGRMTGYSTSGQVFTWKVGGTWESPIDGVRLRALQSRDVRAPNLSELYAANINTNGTVIDDFTGDSVTVLNVATGNTQLKPEQAQTTEMGLVFQPSWLLGFNVSFDYYRIVVKGEIASLTPQQEVDLCFNGNMNVCNQTIVTTDGGTPETSPFSQVIVKVFNLASVVTDGFDMEFNYQASLENWDIPGSLTVRGLVNHTTKFTTDPGIVGQPVAESAGNMTLGAATASNVPLWKAFVTQDYTNERWSVTLSERWVSDGVFNKMYVQCTTGCPAPTIAHPTINNNRQSGALYLDIGGSYNLDERSKVYFKIDNVANVSPPPSPAISAQSYGVNPSLYDVVGRMFRVGVRLNAGQ